MGRCAGRYTGRGGDAQASLHALELAWQLPLGYANLRRMLRRVSTGSLLKVVAVRANFATGRGRGEPALAGRSGTMTSGLTSYAALQSQSGSRSGGVHEQQLF